MYFLLVKLVQIQLRNALGMHFCVQLFSVLEFAHVERTFCQKNEINRDSLLEVMLDNVTQVSNKLLILDLK